MIRAYSPNCHPLMWYPDTTGPTLNSSPFLRKPDTTRSRKIFFNRMMNNTLAFVRFYSKQATESFFTGFRGKINRVVPPADRTGCDSTDKMLPGPGLKPPFVNSQNLIETGLLPAPRIMDLVTPAGRDFGWTERRIAEHFSLPCSTIHGYLFNNSNVNSFGNNGHFQGQISYREKSGVNHAWDICPMQSKQSKATQLVGTCLPGWICLLITRGIYSMIPRVKTMVGIKY